jgi:hypothetical protein
VSLKLTINANDWYAEETLRAMGFSTAILDRARIKGELRCKALGKRSRLYKGQWVLDWLEDGKTNKRGSNSG